MRVDIDNSDFGRILDDPGVTAAAVAVAHQIATVARAIAPKDTGEYAAGIGVTVEQVGAKHPRRGAVVTASAPYSAAVEFGNSHTQAHHVLKRAAEAAKR
jgi:hypothetical protein